MGRRVLGSPVTVAAIIPTIAGREQSLAVAVASVDAQTRPVDEIRVEHDVHHQGPAATRNRAVMWTSSEWLAFLDDDDVWLPNHVETLLAHADGFDVIYPDCELVGDHNGLHVNADFNPLTLRLGNYIPITALVRRSAFMAAGMFSADDRFEDWGLWLRLVDCGARFLHVPVTTWEYRWHGAQRTFA